MVDPCHINPRWISCGAFEAAARHLNFTRADELFTPQSALAARSRQRTSGVLLSCGSWGLR
jgi:hypothetical protein